MQQNSDSAPETGNNQAMVALAILMPVVAGMGGVAGRQSMTIVTLDLLGFSIFLGLATLILL